MIPLIPLIALIALIAPQGHYIGLDFQFSSKHDAHTHIHVSTLDMDPRVAQIAAELGINPSSIHMFSDDDTPDGITDDTAEEPLTGEIHHYSDADGNQTWRRDHYLHRDGNLPAVVNVTNGTMSWYRDGKLHRDGNLPAMINEVATSWYRHGKLHRDGDHPALIVYGGGGGHEYLRDEDGDPFVPTIDLSVGAMCWYRDGVLHRDDGRPAVVLATGQCWDAVDGVPVPRGFLF